MQQLRMMCEGFPVYSAGFPGFPRNFSRDSLIAGLLTNNTEFLREQLDFSSAIQGTTRNAFTGEEAGKIHHEYPGVELNGHSTLFNACDTNALYLISMETYFSLTGDSSFTAKWRRNIERAAQYIIAHTKKNLFYEDPVFCGAKKFALKVTYWKDSQLPHEKEEPTYPIVYTLPHFQAARALESAARLLNREDLRILGKGMVKAGLHALWTGENFLVAVDGDGPIPGPSSDALHVLAYLDPADPDAKKVAEKIEAANEALETPCGYRSVSPDLMLRMKDQYHGGAVVWVFEQALIHYGGKKFGLSRAQEVSRRVRPHLDTDPELLQFGSQGEIVKIGCDPQLWTIASKQYFDTEISPAVL